MGMELGIDKKKLEAFVALWERWTSDPVQLRFVVVVILSLAGIFGVNKPLSSRLGTARERYKEASKQAAMAKELVFFKEQVEIYEPRAGVDSDVSDWQNYVLSNLSMIDAQLISLEPRKTTSKGPFKIVEMDLVAKGQDYNALLDFVDRLERGDRLVRLERLKFEKVQNSISMTCSIQGLVKPGAYKPSKSAGEVEGAVGNDAGVTDQAPTPAQEPFGPSDASGEEASRPSPQVDEASEIDELLPKTGDP